MKPRTLIGMLIAGDELRQMFDVSSEAMAFMVTQRNREMVEQTRHNRDMISQFLIALDQPDTHDDLRETLHAALRDLSDQVARMEENVG